MVFDCVGKGKVIIPWSGHISVLDERVMQMTIESLLNFGHVANFGDASHTDLLPSLLIRLRLRHLRRATFLAILISILECRLILL